MSAQDSSVAARPKRAKVASAPGRTGKRFQLLPDGTGALVRRRLLDLAGIFLVIVGLAILLACLTFSVADPSLNRATEAQPGNLLGAPGAVIADVLFQGFGMAAFFPPLVFICWGWRVLRHHELPHRWSRLAASLAALIGLGFVLAHLPAPSSWPFVGLGLGGTVGELLLRFADLQGLMAWALVLAVMTGALLLALYGLGLTLDEYRSAARSIRWLVQGTRRRLDAVGRRQAEQEVEPEPAGPGHQSRVRREPRLTGAAPAEEPETPEQALGAGADGAPADEPFVAPRNPPVKPGKRAREAAQGRLDLDQSADYELPPLDLLVKGSLTPQDTAINRDSLEKNARILETVLEDFGVKGQIVKVRPGPVVTRYELEPAPGIKTSRVIGLADDIARSMSALSVRVAVVPGSSVIGIELPNARRETVFLRELLASQAYERAGGKLPLILGNDISGAPVLVDLARMPHLLIAGTTGSGKSVSINALILSLLYRMPPDDCKFIMIDPKMLELSVYEGIPHLLSPVVTEPKKAVVALKWTVREMEDRYRAMSRLGVRNIDGYNSRIEEAQKSGETLARRVQTGFDPDTGQPIYEEQPFELQTLPYIVVVVDEMADLMLVAGKDIEAAVQRLAQMARAAGIHILMATQRPSVDVITGTIKANFPTRISFHVTSKIDSRTILGETGAEQLLGQGDMLYMAQGGRVMRVHGPLVTDQEVEKVVTYLKRQGQPTYIEAVTEEDEPGFEDLDTGGGSGDELYDKAVAVVCQHRKASTSFIQRHLQIGYNRAARIIDRMEAEGLVSEANHVGKREILVPGAGDA